MPDVTLRNIPKEVMDRLRTLAAAERRSLNSQILLLLETGLHHGTEDPRRDRWTVSTDTQLGLWEALCGAWKDERSPEEVGADIIRHRTLGRSVDL